MFGSKRHYIYLMGNISTDDCTHIWRENITDVMESDPVVMVNPCLNHWNKQLREAHKTGNTEDIARIRNQAQRSLRPKDYQMIRPCTLAIWNTLYDDPNRPTMASIVEHTWCIDIFKLPVIMIAKEGSPFLSHSWFATYNAAVVTTVWDAVVHVRELYL